MFWILKLFSDWFWWLLLIAGFSSYFLAQMPLLKTYQVLIKIVGLLLVALTIFIFGLRYADNHWQQVAQELQAKIDVAQAESKTANAKIETKVITRTQVVKERGETIVNYIDREIIKIDENCKIPPEFIEAHNKASQK